MSRIGRTPIPIPSGVEQREIVPGVLGERAAGGPFFTLLSPEEYEATSRDEAHAFERLERRGYSVAQISDRVGKPQAYIRQRLALARLTDEAKAALRDGAISVGAAQELASVTDANEQRRVVARALEDESRDVRAAALRLSERWLGEAKHPLHAAVLKRLDDADWAVRRQLAASLGALPASLPPLSAPDLNIEAIKNLMPAALAATLLALTEAVSISRSIAIKSGQHIDGNQEFLGQGLLVHPGPRR